MRRGCFLVGLLLAGLSGGCATDDAFTLGTTSKAKPVLFITTDIGGDPDDMQSLRRLLLYANEFDIRGLVASCTGTPGEVESSVVSPHLIHDILNDYAAVEANLRLHDPAFPHAEDLHRRVAGGDPERSVASIRPGAATDGSRLLIEVVDESIETVNLAIWGGARDLAQALVDVRAQRTPEALQMFVGKLRVYAIGDQDGYNQVIDGKKVDFAGTGKWIKENFPDLRYIETNPPEINRFTALFRGMYQNDSKGGRYRTVPLVSDEVAQLNIESWLEENVLQNHGPLGAGYPSIGQNPGSARNLRGVKEGDTPSWFYFLPIGLGDPEHPEWGGWGGRFVRHQNNHYIDSVDQHWHPETDEATNRKWTVARWREAYQNDFQARMDWCVQNFDGANHPPLVSIVNESSEALLKVDIQAGDWNEFAGQVEDPDGDAVNCRWMVYHEVSGIDPTLIELEGAETSQLRVRCAEALRGSDVHLILEATDTGNPALTRYSRLLLSTK